MNVAAILPPLLASVPSAVPVLAVFFLGWALVMFLVLHLDGNRVR